jgi:predicted ATPase
VRMGMHTGAAEERDGDYFGPALNRCARLMSVAHGGQVAVSEVTAGLVRDSLPHGVGLRDLGEHRLRDLSRRDRVFQLVHPDLPDAFPPLRSLDALPGNLPYQVTSFVGRGAEIETLAELVRERSLVTLTGVGGVGKTRLAVQVAAEVVADFSEGAWICELAAVTDPGAVWESLAATLGVHPSPGRGIDETVLEYLAPKRLLVVLDNCEHLLDAVAGVLDAIARRCSRVAVLATSREGLALAGEQIVAVPSLGLPAQDAAGDAIGRADACRLFCDRAHDAKSDFALSDDNAEAVALLCRRLDGIPLAIELAAARVRSLPPDALVARLDQRFRLLTRGSRAALERHQTLRNTIDWSYDLLDPTERETLDRLSVFAGGCDLAAAEAVVSGGLLEALDVAEVLSQLVEKSLVGVDDSGGGLRYRLLETIRQYAQERLEASGDAPERRRAHAEYFGVVAEEAGPHLRGRGQLVWATRLARDTENFRAVLDWAVETKSFDHALSLVAAFSVHGIALGYSAMDWAETAISIPGADASPWFPRVAAWACWGATMRGDLGHAAELIMAAEQAEAERSVRDPAVRQALATLALFGGDGEASRRHSEEWVDLARAADDAYELAHALILLATTQRASFAAASRATIEEAVSVARDADIAAALSLGLTVLTMQLTEDPERALLLLDEAIDIGTQVGNQQGVVSAIAMKGTFAAQRGDWRSALDIMIDASQRSLQLGELNMLYAELRVAARALADLGAPEAGATLIGACNTHVDLMTPAMEWWDGFVAETNAVLLNTLGKPRVDALAAGGAAMDAGDAVSYLRLEADRILSEADATEEGPSGGSSALGVANSSPHVLDTPPHS